MFGSFPRRMLGLANVNLPWRLMSTRAKKRFYTNVNMVSSGNDHFEIALDSKKLKTPGGSVFTVRNEALAQAIVQEWNSQRDLVMLSQMHITGLSNTSIDNPANTTKYDLVNNVLNFLDTDTLLFFSEDERLQSRQVEQWQPITNWFCQRYEVDVKPSTSLVAEFGPRTRERIRKHLMSYNFEAVQGFSFGVDAIKSVILMAAVADMKLTVKEAVQLSRLELEFQTEFWGNVEWAHDLELHDTNARVAASALFIYCNSSQNSLKTK